MSCAGKAHHFGGKVNAHAPAWAEGGKQVSSAAPQFQYGGINRHEMPIYLCQSLMIAAGAIIPSVRMCFIVFRYSIPVVSMV